MPSALLGGSTASPLVTSPIPTLPVVATSLVAKQTSTVGPYGVGTVSKVETASAGGYTTSLVDSAGAGATVPLWTVTSAGGPPITSAVISANAPITHSSGVQCGSGTLNAGTLAVANPLVTAGSTILVQQTGAAIGATVALSVTAGAGTFTVNGPVGSAATFNWFVAEY